MAKYVSTTLYLRLPDNYSESDIVDALDNTIDEFDGQLIEATEFQNNGLYSDKDFDDKLFDEKRMSHSNDCFYS